MNPERWFSQDAHRVRLEWGRRGASAAASRGDRVVIIDTLRFTTTVAVAASHGASVYPASSASEADAIASRTGAIRGQKRGDGFTLSPRSFAVATSGMRVVLESPNGATCSKLASGAPLVLAGAPVNARAVANVLAAEPGETAVTVIACGERWESHDSSADGELRFALEDFLGAGAIVHELPAHWSRSPEAAAAEAAFLAASANLLISLQSCGSGIELIEKGLGEDLTIAAALNAIDIAPRLIDHERGIEIPIRGIEIPRYL